MEKIKSKILDITEIKSRLLSLMQDFHNYCVKNNLKYTLFYGSLIGAIRHDGFIPWDDDLDIAMPREDYEKLIRDFNGTKFGIIHFSNNKHYCLPFAKAYDFGTLKLEESYSSKKENHGIDIDIFPIDYCQSREQLDLYSRRRERLLRKRIFSNMKFKFSFRPKVIVRNLVAFFYHGKGNKYSAKIDVLGSIFNDGPHNYLKNTTVFGKKDKLFQMGLFDHLTLHKFEDKEFFVTDNFDEVLSTCFGDYMKLPPESERVTHHSYVVYLR